MTDRKKINIPEDRTRNVVPIPRENPLRMMSVLFQESLGKLPAHLVILFVVSALAAISVGVVMKISSAEKASDPGAYLVKRLDIDTSRPALNEEALRGVWALESERYVATLRIGGDIFELVSRPKDNPVNRYFIRGGYRTEGDVLILQARADLGAPYDKAHPEYKFIPIAIRDMNLRAVVRGHMMSWEVPPSEKKRLNPNDRPFLSLLDSPSPWVKLSHTP